MHLGTQGTVAEESGQVQNPPFSALIPNLGRRLKIIAKFTRLIAFFANPSKPRLHLDQPISPIITTISLGVPENRGS